MLFGTSTVALRQSKVLLHLFIIANP